MKRSASKIRVKMRFLLASFLSRSVGYVERRLLKALKLSGSDMTSIFFGELKYNRVFNFLKTYSQVEVFSHYHIQSKRNEFHLFKERHQIVLNDVFLDSRSGIIFDSKKRIITESSSWPVDSLLLAAIPKPFLPYRTLKNEEGLIHLPSTGFYHWLIEDLPPFLKLYQENPKLPLIAHNQIPRYVESTLELIDREIIYVPHFVRINKLLTISRNNDVGWPQREDIDQVKWFFRDLISEHRSIEKVYISRLGARRSPSFEKELIQILSAQGWIVLDSNHVSFPEQIRVISKASTICGVGGAGLAGQIWMQDGSRVIELAPKRYIPANSRLASRLKHDYFCINYDENSMNVRDLVKLIERASEK